MQWYDADKTVPMHYKSHINYIYGSDFAIYITNEAVFKHYIAQRSWYCL